MEDIETRLDTYGIRRSSWYSALTCRGGRRDGVFPSGIADSEDTVMLGLGDSSDDVDDEGEMEAEMRLPLGVGEYGTSGRALSGGLAEGGRLERRMVPVREGKCGDSPAYARRVFLFRLNIDEARDSVPDPPDARIDSAPDVACDSAPESLW